MPALPPFRSRTALALLAALALLTAGCADHHPGDPALVADLRVGVLATFDAMGLSAAQRPGERELTLRVELLAARADPGRVAAVRAGTLAEAGLRAACRDAMRRRAERGERGDAPPDLLVALDHATTPWTPAQCLLFDALLAGYVDEAGLAKPAPGLATGR